MNEAKPYNWGRIARLSQGGNRIAQCKKSKRWAIYDNSGSKPEETDDGVCWIDLEQPALVAGRNPVVVRIPLTDGRACWEPVQCMMNLLLNIPELKVIVEQDVKDLQGYIQLAILKEEGLNSLLLPPAIASE